MAQFEGKERRQAKIDVCLGNSLGTAGKIYSAVFRGNIIKFQSFKLVCNGAFKTQQTGNTHFIIHLWN